ncbi:PLP-dependent aminotransferase family protein [Streptococcus orisratti]|uniref:aminotransferase-like domain-containing protein n=1 Tax=Streptococcus orisratti TaxID=114652 RepID=UPI0023F98726|nr:PLP-dependent aminotransferase family protein [Streptococcus orisratti]
MSKYQDIVSTIAAQINSGQLQKGDKLPSIRLLSQKYQCSKDTAQRALLELKFRNLVYAVEKSGYYVLERKFKQEGPLNISLSDYNNIAFEDFRRCMAESLVNRENYLFNYYHQHQGLEELLTSLKNYLSEDAIYTKEKNILVTSGTQQALYILSQITFPNQKKTILLEQPTYHRMIDLVKAQNLPFLTINRDFEGLDLNQLEKLFKTGDIKFFYTISRFSNPLGLSYSSIEKQKIIELAQRYDVYIVEDDYMGDFAKSNDLPLHYYDISDHVIYLKSFSMTLFPALRLGSLILPTILTETFLSYKKMMDYDTSLIMQKALSLYLDNGMFTKNVTYLRHVFQKQIESAQKVLDETTITYPYNILPQTVILKIAEHDHLGDLTYTDDIHFLDYNYLYPSQKNFVQLQNNANLAQNLQLILSKQSYHN